MRQEFNMTIEHYKSNISANVSQFAANHLINELATVCVERDQLKARVEELEKQLSPKP